MAQTDQPTNVGSNDGLGLVKRLRLIAQWNKPGGRVPIEPLPDKEKTCADAADEIERLRAALAESCDEHRSQMYEAGPGGGCPLLRDAVAAERARWQRIAAAAQALTTYGTDQIDQFEIPAHLMAALALALDEGPNDRNNRPASAGPVD